MTFLDFCPTSSSTPTSDIIVVKVWQIVCRLTERAQLLEGERISTITICDLLTSFILSRTSFLKDREGQKRKKDDATRVCLCIAVVVMVISVCYP